MLYGLLTGVFIAGYTVVDGYAVKLAADVADPARLLRQLRSAAVPAAAGAARPGRPPPALARAVAVRAGGGGDQPGAYVLVLYAMQVAPLSHVAPAREVSMLFAALIGGHLLGEGDRLARMPARP